MSHKLFGKKRGDWSDDPPEQEYWLSYSDLMAGLLMVFALMLIVALIHYGNRLSEWHREIERVTSMQERSRIIEELRAAVEEKNAPVSVDSVTGRIRLSDNVLFAENESRLSADGRQVLTTFVRDVLPIVLQDRNYRANLRQIVVEGHTNDNGSYEYNLRLSQDRAYAVMQHMIAVVEPKYRGLLEKHMIAAGRSESWPICGDSVLYLYDPECDRAGGVDDALSRRIEISFLLNDDEVLKEVQELMDAAGLWLSKS